MNRLAEAVSPYLRSHAGNPVDWREWGSEAFAEAERRDVPLLVSIGYSTCHWCHVMARESFSDPAIAAVLNEGFVAVKVDREEHPDVDASYLAAASAFTQNLGWPLNVFVTPQGRAFYAGTYWPPQETQGHPAFRTVLDAVVDAWTQRRQEVEQSASVVAEALATVRPPAGRELPGGDRFADIVQQLLEREDAEFGGFGTAPKFPMAPVLMFLIERGAGGDVEALELADRTLRAMADSPLRDRVEGGFFRYSTRRDWSEPHYERMLYDNALLLQAYTRLAQLVPGSPLAVVEGIASFLLDVLALPAGGFASAQDSESEVDGVRVEGGYYALDRAGRARQTPPALDEKMLTGWNGLAIGALAAAGQALGRREWLEGAIAAADRVVAGHLRDDGTLIRASVAGRASAAKATLEDYGMLAGGLLRLALATGELRYAETARQLVDGALAAAAEAGGAAGGAPFGVPGGVDAVLQAQGLAAEPDPSEGAYPSGATAMAEAARMLYLLTGEPRYLAAATAAMETVAGLAVERPTAFGAALALMAQLREPIGQLVVVTDEADDPLTAVARRWYRAGAVSVAVTPRQAARFAEAGYELFEGRQERAAYLCEDFVCRLPITDAEELQHALGRM